MGTILEFRPEKLVIAVLARGTARKSGLFSVLEDGWGRIDFTSSSIPFDFTDYYEREMGPSLQRFFVSFERLVDPSRLAEIKRATNAIEDRFRDRGGRTVNLDPGLLCNSRFVLATTKEGAHRIPLVSGIYAEVTLLFEKGSFRTVEWTYPDYRSREYIGILNTIRGLYRNQVRVVEASHA